MHGARLTLASACPALRSYTSLPVLAVAVLDRDVEASTALALPYLYVDGAQRKRLSLGLLLLALSDALLCGLLVFFVSAQATADSVLRDDGASAFVFELGTTCFSGVLVVVSVRLAAMAHSLSPLFLVLLALSAAAWVPVAALSDALDSDRCAGCFARTFSSPTFALVLLLLGVATHVVLLAARAWRRAAAPDYRDTVLAWEAVSARMDPLVCAEARARLRRWPVAQRTEPPQPRSGAAVAPAAAEPAGLPAPVPVRIDVELPAASAAAAAPAHFFRRTASDMSIDDRSAGILGNFLSTLGRLQLRRAVASASAAAPPSASPLSSERRPRSEAGRRNGE
jgi:hypothetical protein